MTEPRTSREVLRLEADLLLLTGNVQRKVEAVDDEILAKARKLLEALVEPCNAPPDTPDGDHSWRLCRRCMAIRQFDFAPDVTRILVERVLAALRASGGETPPASPDEFGSKDEHLFASKGRDVAGIGGAVSVPELRDRLSNVMVRHMIEEASKASARSHADARAIGCSDEQRHRIANEAFCETVRSYLAQAGVVASAPSPVAVETWPTIEQLRERAKSLRWLALVHQQPEPALLLNTAELLDEIARRPVAGETPAPPPQSVNARVLSHAARTLYRDLVDTENVLAFDYATAPEPMRREAHRVAREALRRITAALSDHRASIRRAGGCDESDSGQHDWTADHGREFCCECGVYRDMLPAPPAPPAPAAEEK